MTDRDAQRFWRNVQKQDGDGCWLWTASKGHGGYGEFHWVRVSEDYVQGKAHRFSWELHHGPIPQGLCVLHACDVPACVRPDHLWLGTVADNNRDCDVKGRRARFCGEQHGCAKLTEENVREIRALRASGISGGTVARRFRVSQTSISQIIHGKRWRHVEGIPCGEPKIPCRK